MSKNPYSKTVKMFSKSESLYINRDGEEIYISEGHFIVKMHVAAYDAFFRPVSGLFLELADGEKATKNGNMRMTEKIENGFDLVKFFNDFKYDGATELVNASPFLMEYSRDGKKKEYQRMLTGSGYYVSINNDFYQVAEEIGFTSFFGKGNSVSAVYAEAGNNGILILPIRLNQQELESFISAGSK